MQQHSLLQTKLYIPPIRPELISRPRLIEQLNAGPPTRGDLSRTQDVFPRALAFGQRGGSRGSDFTDSGGGRPGTDGKGVAGG